MTSDFFLANCGTPTSPESGYLEAYENTTEGVMISFRCELGFIPAGRMRAVCASNGRWRPNPADLRCTGEQLVGEIGGGREEGGIHSEHIPSYLPTHFLPSSLLKRVISFLLQCNVFPILHITNL